MTCFFEDRFAFHVGAHESIDVRNSAKLKSCGRGCRRVVLCLNCLCDFFGARNEICAVSDSPCISNLDVFLLLGFYP